MDGYNRLIHTFNGIGFAFIALPLGHLFWGFISAVGGEAVAQNFQGLEPVTWPKFVVLIVMICIGNYYLGIVKHLKAKMNYQRCHKAAVLMIFIFFPVGLYCCAKLNDPKVKAIFYDT